MSARPVVVVKLGGSLLSQPNWPVWLEAWLAAQPPGEFLMIVGGGQTIDAMRYLDQAHTLETRPMHWRCIRLLDATFEVAAEILQRPVRRFTWQLIASSDQLASTFEPVRTAEGSHPLTEPSSNSHPSPPLPHDAGSVTAAERSCTLVRVAAYYQPQSHANPMSATSTDADGDDWTAGTDGAWDTNAVPEDWRTTTDCLALHLGHRVGAARVVLFKSCPVGHLSGLEQAVNEGIVDPAARILCRHWSPHTLQLVQFGSGPQGPVLSTCGWSGNHQRPSSEPP